MARLGDPVERRQFGRRETSLHGLALIPGRPDAPCVLRNMSMAGARLEFPCEVWLPFRFELVVESRGLRVWCEIRHQRGATAGVMFSTERPGEMAIVPAFCSERERQGSTTVQPPAQAPSPGPVMTGSSLRARVLQSKG